MKKIEAEKILRLVQKENYEARLIKDIAYVEGLPINKYRYGIEITYKGWKLLFWDIADIQEFLEGKSKLRKLI
jgi:hypothetical protein